METKQFDTPILFLIFKRIDTTNIVFEEIRKMRPKQLFIAGDGGRTPEEHAKCEQTRKVVEKIDWPCEIRTLWRDTNLGCSKAVSSAISWFFSYVERGIILEDDCLPDQSFFAFCEILLEKYKNDKRIMHISGDNFQQANPKFIRNESYYFSRIPHIWGWASWRRAWKLYDVELKKWPKIKKQRKLHDIFKDGAIAYRWGRLFDHHRNKALEHSLDTWDGQWVFACLAHNGLCINPKTNLVSNIGFGADARRTYNPNDELAAIPLVPVKSPLRHPKTIAVNEIADAYTHSHIFNINRYWIQRIKWFCKSKLTKYYLYAKYIYFKLLNKQFESNEATLID